MRLPWGTCYFARPSIVDFMRVLVFIGLMLLLRVPAFAQAWTAYTSPASAAITPQHRLLAVLPFAVQFQLRPAEVVRLGGPAGLASLEQAEGVQVQAAVREYLQAQQVKMGLSYTVQDPEQTNIRLREHGVTTAQVATVPPQQLAQWLGVDAVLTGSFGTVKPVSDGAALALGAGLSAVTGVGVYGTNTAWLKVFLWNAPTGELLWQFTRDTSRGLNAGTRRQILFMMQSAKRRFPYASPTPGKGPSHSDQAAGGGHQ